MGIVEMLVGRGIERGIKAIHDAAWEKGFKMGIEEVKAGFVKNLLTANKSTDAEIANFADVTEAFVRKVKKSLK